MIPTWTEVLKMVRDAYNEGFSEGMKEHTNHDGGKPWQWSTARKNIDARMADTSAKTIG